jgi:hypothetical protein
MTGRKKERGAIDVLLRDRPAHDPENCELGRQRGSDDQDYYIDAATIDVIGDGRATDDLLRLLRTALGDAKGVDIRWNRR